MEKQSVDTLIPYPKNAKKHPKKQIEQIKNSIQEFGFNQPIVVDKDNVVIVGHGRLEAAKLLGLKEVPTLTVDLSKQQADAYRLADNKLNESDWDMELVVEELKELDMAGFDIELTGFDADLIIEPEDRDDKVPDVPDEPTSKLGDIYQLGEHRLMCGDSTNIEDVEKLMDGQKADMVFTDPPYGVGFKYNSHDDNVTDEEYEKFSRAWFENANEVTNFIVVTTGQKQKRMWYRIDESVEEMVWFKKFSLSPGKVSYVLLVEPIMVWGKCLKERYRTDFFEIMTDREKDIAGKHTCPKPVQLSHDLIQPQTNKDDIVLDLFGGSGSTLIACEKLNRKCHMMELDPKYVDVIIKRWEDYTGQTAVKL